MVTKEELPKLIKGNGIPVRGISPEMAEILTMAWPVIQAITPRVSNLPNWLWVFFAMLIKVRANIRKSESKIMAPTKPSSSTIIANMESPTGSGR